MTSPSRQTEIIERRTRLGLIPPVRHQVRKPIAPIDAPTDEARKIVEQVIERHRVNRDAFSKPWMRTVPLAMARREAAYRLRHEAKLSWKVIGHACGFVDHSSAVRAAQKHKPADANDTFVPIGKLVSAIVEDLA